MKILQAVKSRITNIIPVSRDRVHSYWKNPNDGVNKPQEYIGYIDRSIFLEGLLSKYCAKNSNILEIGCNIGRNLNYLNENGYSNLTGVEISSNAIDALNKQYPHLSRKVKIYNECIENIIEKFSNHEFDVVFTMAVLEHVHPDSEWIFSEIARTANIVVTIEDEINSTWRHFKRNYEHIFTQEGMHQLESKNFVEIESLSGAFYARVLMH